MTSRHPEDLAEGARGLAVVLKPSDHRELPWPEGPKDGEAQGLRHAVPPEPACSPPCYKPQPHPVQ